MAEYNKQIEQQIEALKENIYTINMCLNFDKSKEDDWDGNSKIGCLGIPSMILICSLIDTIGSVFRGSNMNFSIDGNNYKINTASDHFYILNHERFFNLNLSMITITDFYETYRSKLTHNNSIPANNYLSIGNITDNIFELNCENMIVKIKIKPLFEETKNAVDTLIYYLKNGTFSDDHKLSKELDSKAKNYNENANNRPSDTGYTMTTL